MSWQDEMHKDLIEFFGLDLPENAFDISFKQDIEAYAMGFCNCCDGSVEVTKRLCVSYTLPVRKHRSVSLPNTTWEDFFRWVDMGKPER